MKIKTYILIFVFVSEFIKFETKLACTMVSFHKIMNKVAPKLAAINQFGRHLESGVRGVHHGDGDQKKVKFDLATVSFRVNYDTADYRCHHHHSHHSDHYRHHKRPPYPHLPAPRIPLWKAHLDPPPNKSNICLYILRQLTFVQWLQLFFILFCFIQAIIQCFQLYNLYQK